MHKLHFSGETVSDALSSDIQALNKLSNQQFSALTEIIFHFVTEPTESVRLLNELSEFASKNGMSSGPLKNILKNVLLVPYGALKRNLTADHIKADFITLGEEKAGCFADQWKLHSTVLSRLALEQTMTVNQLVDMEWKFGGIICIWCSCCGPLFIGETAYRLGAFTLSTAISGTSQWPTTLIPHPIPTLTCLSMVSCTAKLRAPANWRNN
ncbi:COMM domain-containing protein 7-like isoform X2 [Narcine bancroftii]|uniref:COMM domain-containing protein 7-like isoform X2 n=1 Tax=Narcine bancroftii TaxID=1343680 RepID=UPI00383184C7